MCPDGLMGGFSGHFVVFLQSTVRMSYTDQTLSEQLHLGELEIAKRKSLLDFVDADIAALLSCKDLVAEHIDSIVLEFYARQTAVEEIALTIGDADTMSRLHVAQRAYVLSLFDGYYDLEYVDSRLRIGMVHKRIGVEPKFYISAMKMLRDLCNVTLGQHIHDKKRLQRVRDALEKLFYFDMTLVIDTFMHCLAQEVELSNNKMLAHADKLEATVVARTRKFQALAEHDPLTGLFNRRSLGDYLRRELHTAKRHRRVFSLAYFDVDDFKQINDTRGHYAGDEVLCLAGEAMENACRDIDFPCRCGGDEFCLAMPECSLADAVSICQRLVEQFKKRVPDVTLSIGIVQTGPDEFLEQDELLRHADARMYKAKSYPGFKICC